MFICRFQTVCLENPGDTTIKTNRKTWQSINMWEKYRQTNHFLYINIIGLEKDIYNYLLYNRDVL